MNDTYRRCTRCIMDTSDPDIEFDDNGICNHCKLYDYRISRSVFSGDEGKEKLNKIVHKIKEKGISKEYDCIIGLSGGVDSTYTAYLVQNLGLRPLAVHLDNGWDSELAVKNIENIVRELDIDLYTHVMEWEEFKDIQLSFLKASTPDSEIPSDHAIFSLLYDMANKKDVKYVILGTNIRTESHLPNAWSRGHYDWKYIMSIQKQFGRKIFNTFPHMNLWKLIKMRFKTQKWFEILNYIDYTKKDAMRIIEAELGWKYYGGKHYESIYTRFYQGFWLPQKFGFDKRKCHLSSLICSGEITREEALKELENETYPLELQNDDKEYVIKKFGLSKDEFERIMDLPWKTYFDYPNYDKLYIKFLFKVASKIGSRIP